MSVVQMWRALATLTSDSELQMSFFSVESSCLKMRVVFLNASHSSLSTAPSVPATRTWPERTWPFTRLPFCPLEAFWVTQIRRIWAGASVSNFDTKPIADEDGAEGLPQRRNV